MTRSSTNSHGGGADSADQVPKSPPPTPESAASGSWAVRSQHLKCMLKLQPTALSLLEWLWRLDVDAQLSQQVQQADPFHRPGILPWHLLLQLDGGATPVTSWRDAIRALSSWGLLQVVGTGRTDPVTPGSTALRLTHQGHECVNGGPGLEAGTARVDVSMQSTYGESWLILHGASREDLVQRARDIWGAGLDTLPVLIRPESGGDAEIELQRTCGRVAAQLFFSDIAWVDGWREPEQRGSKLGWPERLLLRTPRAAGKRILLIDEPAEVRLAAVATGATLCWVPPATHTKRRTGNLSEAVSQELAIKFPESSVADHCGVPESSLAYPVRVQVGWEELVVPSDLQRRLELCVLSARYRLGSLNGPLAARRGGEGYRLLISGPPGTGKSMIAEAMATELKRPLVRFDLSTVLSKWLGETEKLLSEIFDMAEAASALMVIDEAEAIMQQRSQNSRGGGALVTGVAYLLTRLERYNGVLVATTNRTEDLDDAFFRRFDDYLVVPLPDEASRTRLWKLMLNDAYALDSKELALLAGEFAIGGALIRGVCQRAIAWSLGGGPALCLESLLASLVLELEKSNIGTFDQLPQAHRRTVERLLGRGQRS